MVGGARYLHVSALSDEVRDVLRAEIAGLGGPVDDSDFNVVKLVPDSTRLSLLHYPSYFERAFPPVSYTHLTLPTSDLV